jgi:hypothetical protein
MAVRRSEWEEVPGSIPGQIQELLGHKHLDSTWRYTRVTAYELQGRLKRLNLGTPAGVSRPLPASPHAATTAILAPFRPHP